MIDLQQPQQKEIAECNDILAYNQSQKNMTPYVPRLLLDKKNHFYLSPSKKITLWFLVASSLGLKDRINTRLL